ncbi:hypothetical protein AVEN_247507-1, partial [Araneus ventricosus]
MRKGVDRGKSWNSIRFGFSLGPLGYKLKYDSRLGRVEPLSQKRKPQDDGRGVRVGVIQ